MPTIQIDLKNGYSLEQKRVLVREATRVTCEVLRIAPEGVRILLRDIGEENYAVAGQLWSDYLSGSRDGGGEEQEKRCP
jgi:4-oxalocrotonate tautomerase